MAETWKKILLTGEAISVGAITSNGDIVTTEDLKIGDGKYIGSTTQPSAMAISSDGIITKPYNPSFSAYVSTTQTNVTGNDVIYEITGAFWTEYFDVNAYFTNGTFTAPATGKYAFTGQVYTYPNGGREVQIRIETSNRDYTPYYGLPQSYSWTPVAMICDMDADDTAHLAVKVFAGSQDVEVGATATVFSGSLLG